MIRLRHSLVLAILCFGPNPADLPIERPSKFELVVSLKTAKNFGIVVPAAVLLRADEGVE
jgi:putative ABC transport system substrate-binding protein